MSFVLGIINQLENEGNKDNNHPSISNCTNKDITILKSKNDCANEINPSKSINI
jgi:hypothetical protein